MRLHERTARKVFRVAGSEGLTHQSRSGAFAVRSCGQYLGYLNLTPRQGQEAQASWTSFRPRHNVAEGEKDVTVMDSATGLRFRSGHGSCVRDTYTTSTNARYVEIACLVDGRRASSVIVGAALSRRWAEERSVIERAISALIT